MVSRQADVAEALRSVPPTKGGGGSLGARGSGGCRARATISGPRPIPPWRLGHAEALGPCLEL
eukprot:1947621-Pyramimonas_sp.AAC.1